MYYVNYFCKLFWSVGLLFLSSIPAPAEAVTYKNDAIHRDLNEIDKVAISDYNYYADHKLVGAGIPVRPYLEDMEKYLNTKYDSMFGCPEELWKRKELLDMLYYSPCCEKDFSLSSSSAWEFRHYLTKEVKFEHCKLIDVAASSVTCTVRIIGRRLLVATGCCCVRNMCEYFR
eukprot:GHVS01108756.1.p1 GENE.GHVS01108756.1~~GHVS01108756.1.p1  ORF type:complete len:173 (+),score=20.90 GHVS01108756.1:222-740(+)